MRAIWILIGTILLFACVYWSTRDKSKNSGEKILSPSHAKIAEYKKWMDKNYSSLSEQEKAIRLKLKLYQDSLELIDNTISFDGSGDRFSENIRHAVNSYPREPDKIPDSLKNIVFDSLKNIIRPSDTLIFIELFRESFGSSVSYSASIYQSFMPDIPTYDMTWSYNDLPRERPSTGVAFVDRAILNAIKDGTIDSISRMEEYAVLDAHSLHQISVITTKEEMYTVKYYNLINFVYRLPTVQTRREKKGEIVQSLLERESSKPSRKKKRQAYRDSLQLAGNILVFKGTNKKFINNVRHALTKSPVIASSHDVLSAQRESLFHSLKASLQACDTVVVMELFSGQDLPKFRPDYQAVVYQSSDASFAAYQIDLDYNTCDKFNNLYSMYDYILTAIKKDRMEALLRLYKEVAPTRATATCSISVIVKKNDDYIVKYYETQFISPKPLGEIEEKILSTLYP